MSQALAELQAEFKIACENVGEAYVNARVARQRLKDALARREHMWSRFTQFQRMETAAELSKVMVQSEAPNLFRNKHEGPND
jgi:hypothetical protein